MKKLALYLILIVFILSSCKKSELNIDNEIIKEMALLKSEKELKLAYKTLNEIEQAAVWKNHIREYLISDLNKDQKELLIDLVGKNKPSIFKERDEKFMEYGKSWLTKASKQFSRDEIAKIVVNLQSINSESYVTTSSGAQDCGCKKSNSVITLCGGAWNNNEECKTANCTETSEFCGFLLLERCDGQCTIPQPTPATVD